MSKTANTGRRTLRCTAHLYSKGAHHRLHNIRVAVAHIKDAALDAMLDTFPGQTVNPTQADKLTTNVVRELHQTAADANRHHQPSAAEIAAMQVAAHPLNRRANIAAVQQSAVAYSNHVQHQFSLPAKYHGNPVRTIPSFAHGQRHRHPWLFITGNDKRRKTAVLMIPNMPTLRLTACQEFPDQQPTFATVSCRGRKISVSIVYPVDQEPLPPEGQWDPYAVLGIDFGIDFGIVELIATNARISFQGIKQQRLQEKINRQCRYRERLKRNAVRRGIAGYRPVCDEHGVQIKTATGKPRREFYWLTKPTHEYRRVSSTISGLFEQRMRQRRNYRHQVAAAIVKFCNTHGIQLIAVEKLNLKGMTKSNRGTVANPGRNRQQKRSLNRRILEQGWAILLKYITYKARQHGIRIVQVHAAGSSQTCSRCGHRNAKSRHGKTFLCVAANCCYQADADENAAANIGDRGTHAYVRKHGVTLAQVRQNRLAGSTTAPPKLSSEQGLGPAPTAHPTGNPTNPASGGCANANQPRLVSATTRSYIFART